MRNLRHNTTFGGDGASYRGLWGAVVLQAISDIETEPLQSLEYAHAVAFFTSGGEWAQTRAIVSDFLQLHRDEIEKFGRRRIDQRRRAEGLDPLSACREPKRREVAHREAIESKSVVTTAQTTPDPARARTAHLPRPRERFNPFFPRGIYAT